MRATRQRTRRLQGMRHARQGPDTTSRTRESWSRPRDPWPVVGPVASTMRSSVAARDTPQFIRLTQTVVNLSSSWILYLVWRP